MNEPRAGDRLGRYRLVSILGRGEAGTVFLALDEQLRRNVALRLFPGDADPAVRERTLDDARRAMRLSHPGIAAVHEIGEANELLFLVTEYVRGATMLDRLEAAGTEGLDRRWILERVAQAAEAIAAAHEVGVPHGSLGPQNLSLTPQDGIKVMDFGLWRLRAHLAARTPDREAVMRGDIDALVTLLRDQSFASVGSARELARRLRLAQAGRGHRIPARGMVLAAAVAAGALVLAVPAYRLARSPASDSPGAGHTDLSGLRIEPLLVQPGMDRHAVLSPDGTKLVYARGTHLVVALVETAGRASSETQLTSGEGAESEPVWSPDGGRIAFTHERPDGEVDVSTVPSEGGPVTRVVVGASSPSWSPDGRRIAFMQRGIGRSSTVLTVEADGRWSRPVTRPEAAYFHTDPAWSPDGRTIAFVKDSGGGSATEIWLAPVDGGEPRQLTREAEGIFSSSPAWTPDSRWIVYSSNRGGTQNIWRLPSAGGEPERLTAGPGDDDDPHVASDGRRIVFGISKSLNGLFTFDRTAQSERIILTDAVAALWGPSFSPDGRSIAYTRIDPAGPRTLFVAGADGGSPRQLTTPGVSALRPRWSPDGATIAFCSFGKGDNDIMLIPAAGGDARRLGEAEDDECWPTWSPDGKEIVYARTEDDKTFLYRLPAAGGVPVRVSGVSLTLPDFSPDGSSLAVARNRSFRNGVGILPADGGELRWLSDTGGWPVFRPDGKAIGFIRLEPGGRQSLWEVDLEGGDPRRIEGPRFSLWNVPFDYASDVRTLAYTNSLAAESDLWMLRLP